jgi:integrase
MPLTVKTIARLKPPKTGSTIIYDNEISGFGVRIFASGAVSFALNYSFQRQERRIALGRYPVMNLAQARIKALKFKSQIADGIDPLEDRREDREAPTVLDLRLDYLERHARPYKRPSSIRDDQRMLDIVAGALGKKRVDAVTRRDIESLHQQFQATPYRANRILALLHKMFRLAVQWEWRTDNPCSGIQKFHEDKRVRRLDPDEMSRFAAALDAYEKRGPEAKRIVDAIRLIMLTGSRKSEVLKATWDQFDLSRGIWSKPSHETKQRRLETIPLNEAAWNLVRSLERDGPLLFPGRKEGQPIAELKWSWSEICKLAKIKNLRVHDLRHHFASELVNSGASLYLVGKLLGHSQPSTTQRYAHADDDPLRKATNLFAMKTRAAKV